MCFRFFFSPLTWLSLILFFFLEVNLGILPLEVLAITQETLINPLDWHSFLTAGLTHKTLTHLLINLVLLSTLAYFFTQKIGKKSSWFFTKWGLIINLLHSFTLSIIIQGNSFPTFIYGSSGIVCGIASFLWRKYPKDSSRSFFLLRKAIISTTIFSLLDILIFSSQSLSSWSHLLGILLGFVLSYAYPNNQER